MIFDINKCNNIVVTLRLGYVLLINPFRLLLNKVELSISTHFLLKLQFIVKAFFKSGGDHTYLNRTHFFKNWWTSHYRPHRKLRLWTNYTTNVSFKKISLTKDD